MIRLKINHENEVTGLKHLITNCYFQSNAALPEHDEDTAEPRKEVLSVEQRDQVCDQKVAFYALV